MRTSFPIAIAVLLSLAGPAVAHLDPLAGRDPFVVDGALVGGATSWGLVLQDPASASSADPAIFRRVCEEAVGAAMLLAHRTPDGRVLVATLDGLIESADGGCSWDPVEGLLANLEVSAIRSAPAAPEVVYASTSRAGAPNGVWKSVDGGAHFVETALAGAIDPLLELAVADDGNAVFVSGLDLDLDGPLLRGSLDGGASFFAASFDLSLTSRVRVLAVDDERVWLSLFDVAGVPRLASADLALGALRTEASFGNDVTDLALLDVGAGAAGATPFALVRPGALYRKNGDATWSLVEDVTLSCLRRVSGDPRLWGCTSSPKQFAVSADGVVFTPMLGHEDVEERVCPAGTYGALACPSLPPDEPPLDDPPGDEPPVDEPPGEEPPVDEPPADEPSGDEPLGPPPVAPGEDATSATATDAEDEHAEGLGCAQLTGAPLFAVLALGLARRRRLPSDARSARSDTP